MKPVSFALGLAALQPPAAENSNGVLALAIGESHGVAANHLRRRRGGACARSKARLKTKAGRRTLHADLVAREARITLGQLPAELRDAVKRIRIFGPRELAQQLADEMELRFEPMGLSVEVVAAYAPDEFGVQLPPDASLSAAFSLAARLLAEQPPAFEFLPPKPTLHRAVCREIFLGPLADDGRGGRGHRGDCRRVVFVPANSALAAALAMVGHVGESRGAAGGAGSNPAIPARGIDDTFRDLAILRQLSLAFPEDGVVTAKTIEIQDDNTVSCSGNAQDNAALLAMLAKLRAADGVSDLKVDMIHGKAPMQFTFDFQYGNGGAQ